MATMLSCRKRVSAYDCPGHPRGLPKALAASLILVGLICCALAPGCGSVVYEGAGGEETGAPRHVVGKWRDEHSTLGRSLIIYRQGGRLFLEQTFRDGSGYIEELWERESRRGPRLETDNRFGDYFVIDRQGNLEIGDSDGVIGVARKIP